MRQQGKPAEPFSAFSVPPSLLLRRRDSARQGRMRHGAEVRNRRGDFEQMGECICDDGVSLYIDRNRQ